MSTDAHTTLQVSVSNFQAGGLGADGTYDFSGLTDEFRLVADPAPNLLVLCPTDPAAWLWPVTRDFAKITCSRRRRIAGRARVARIRDRGRYAGRRGVVPA